MTDVTNEAKCHGEAEEPEEFFRRIPDANFGQSMYSEAFDIRSYNLRSQLFYSTIAFGQALRHKSTLAATFGFVFYGKT